MTTPVFFGVRHLSPAAAYHVRRYLEEIRPDIVLVEGPSDLTEQIKWFCHPQTILPAAILAYTQQTPIRTLLYPFAEYAPEYQAILWAHQNKVPCRFMDLPSDVFLALQETKQDIETKIQTEIQGSTTESIYHQLEEMLGESHDTFWERRFEQLDKGYLEAAQEFGKQLRKSAKDTPQDFAENLIREAYMKRRIEEAVSEGFQKIFCVCGAYHVLGLQSNVAMTDEEEKMLPRVPSHATLMPYSYYRLSTRAGYGAGNQAPAYFELLWQAWQKEDLHQASYQYFSQLAALQRKQGQMTSVAEVIEATRLAQALAGMHNSRYPVLQDLRDAAITCMGHGNFAEISISVASVEIGTKIGALPEGVSRTSIQEDFYHQLKELRLEKYRSPETQHIDLDLREKLQVKSEKAAFLDLHRSFFLHRLRVLRISFGVPANLRNQSVWKEGWSLCWVPETEIQMVEAALLGETVQLAASFALKEYADKSEDIAQAAQVFEDAFLCGIPQAAEYALSALQHLSIDTSAIEAVSKTAEHLSNVIRYGDLRHFRTESIIPLLTQLFLRACFTMENACQCDDAASTVVMESMERINRIQLHHDFLDETRWLDLLTTIADRDDLNTKCSGFAMATLIERGMVEENFLLTEVSRRLSKGVPADLGAGWFEGLAQKNRYSLIMRLSLWRQLDSYLQELDDIEFKRALIFLRRAFADFSPNEKNDIAENLGEVWGIDTQQAAELLMQDITEAEQEMLQGLDDFDFEDI